MLPGGNGGGPGGGPPPPCGPDVTATGGIAIEGGIDGGIDPGGGTGGKAPGGGMPGMAIAAPSVVRTGVGAVGGGGASANSW